MCTNILVKVHRCAAFTCDDMSWSASRHYRVNTTCKKYWLCNECLYCKYSRNTPCVLHPINVIQEINIKAFAKSTFI